MTPNSTYKRAFPAMASQCEVVIEGVDDATAQQWAALAIQEVDRIEHKYSRYSPDSVVSKINTMAGMAPIECDEETLSLINYADALHQTSGGLFDISSGILRKAWDFQKGVLPAEDQLATLLDLIGWQKIERNKNTIRLPLPGMEIDFGGFGKEYAADRAASILMSGGIKHGYVNMAGDIRVIGPKVDGSPWSMGIQDPRSPEKIIATIPVTQGGLATSGDYERYFEVAGKRYCHVLNPRTGFPCAYWRSISVLAPLAVMAGSFTTIAMLKEKDAVSFLEDADVAYMAIDQFGNVHNQSRDQQTTASAHK